MRKLGTNDVAVNAGNLKKNSQGFYFPTEIIKTTKDTLSEEVALKRKMDSLQPKILGRKVFTYDIEKVERVYAPFHFFTFDYDINRKLGYRRQGQLCFVHDLEANFPFYFDQTEDTLKFKLIPYEEIKDSIIDIGVDYKDAVAKCRVLLEKRMFRFYRTSAASYKLVENWLFFRPALKLHLNYKGTQFIRYAYLDDNETSCEPLNSMKFRVEN